MDDIKLAAIDIGTNSFHMIVAKILTNGHFEIIDREKEVIRLSLNAEEDKKYILPESMHRALNCLKKFKEIALSHNAEIRAVATSAVREAKNRSEFEELVEKNCGIKIEVISGIEEARLVYLGAMNAVSIADKKTLTIDIGGGSVEFIVGKNGEILSASSLKLGAVRLSSMFFPDFKITKDSIKECENWVKGELYRVAEEIKKIGFQICVGASGTIHAASAMIAANLKNVDIENFKLNNSEILADELDEIYQIIIKNKTPEERKKIQGLDEKRADIIPAGIIALREIFKSLNLRKMIVSEFGLREGAIVDWIIKKKILSENVLSNFDIRKKSFLSYIQKFNFDKKHCEWTAKLSRDLFFSLKEQLNLQESDFEYLELAALAHDIGYHISHSKHHIHSYYILRNAEVFGFNDLELEIIANIARYHRKSGPKKNHFEFYSLPEEKRELTFKLACILRIADALDRTHRKNIQEAKAYLTSKILTLIIAYEKIFPEIELWSLNRRKSVVEKYFNRKIECKLIKSSDYESVSERN